MKNLFTLFLTFLTALCFAQETLPGVKPVKFVNIDPNSISRPALHNYNGSTSRSSMGCDTVDALDYNTYEEISAAAAQISFNGSWNVASPQIAVAELTSTFIDIPTVQVSEANNIQAVSFAMGAFDTLAFSNYGQTSQYSMSLAGSSISFDSMGMFIGIFGDTVSADGKMTNDSLVFRIYTINNGIVSTTQDTSLNFTGYAGLAPFFTGTGYLHGVVIPVGVSFNAGQGFAVRAEYYRADTSSHCYLSYTFADSCVNIVIQGHTYLSPAYPGPFIRSAKYSGIFGSNFYGEIDSISPTTASVKPVGNSESYNLSSLGIPQTCSYVYIQNWEMIPYVTVTSSLGLGFASDTITLPCNHQSTHRVSAISTGDLAGAQYAWSSSQTTSYISTTTPGVYTVTVTNPLGCSASASVTIMYPGGANVNPAFTVPDSLCIGAPAAFINQSSNITTYGSTWNFGEGTDSLSAAVNPTYTYTAAGTFPVTLTMDSGGCAFTTSQTVTVTQYCTGIQNVAFENSISVLPNPSNGNVNITVNGAENGINITIYNVLGQSLKSFSESDVASVFNKNLDLGDLSEGTYILKIQSGSKIATKKLVITK